MPPEVNEKLSTDLSEQVIHRLFTVIIVFNHQCDKTWFLFSSILIKGG